MNEEIETVEVKKQKPQVFFNSITFNDGTKMSLRNNSIVVFTGANNSGKSQVLRDAENCVNSSTSVDPIVIKDVTLDYLGEVDEPDFLDRHFMINGKGEYLAFEASYSTSLENLKSYWQRHNLVNGLHNVFIKRLGTELRLTVSNALKRDYNAEKHPIFKLLKSDTLTRKLLDYFHQAFGEDLVVNRNEMQTVPLHVGKAPNSKSFTMDMHDDYYEALAALPKLQEQGDGMRSFVSILLDTFTSERSITLIDEPEAFLHPPQARILGKMLAKNNPNNRQLFISTHSEDFLQGLLDADNENVTVVRINRENNLNKMSVLQNDEIKKLWSNPILRYSNILSGLFHEKVVVCESDYDCLFYQALINAIYEQKGELAPDILFTHCGGKARAKDVVVALKAVNVPVVSICDFDLLDQSQYFKPLIKAFGAEWSTILSSGMKTIYDSMNGKSKEGNNAWERIKKIGKSGFADDEPAAYEKVEVMCKSIGLFVVPVGEMECFDKTINKQKKDWVYHVLENYDLATELKLESARKFIEEVVDYRLSESD